MSLVCNRFWGCIFAFATATDRCCGSVAQMSPKEIMPDMAREILDPFGKPDAMGIDNEAEDEDVIL